MTLLFPKKLFFQITLIIALPALVLGIAGRLADKHYGTSPWILLAALFAALHVTLALLLFRFKDLLSELKLKGQKSKVKTTIQNLK